MLAGPTGAQQAASRAPLVIDRDAIVDVIAGKATPDMAVVIRGNRITEIGGVRDMGGRRRVSCYAI